MGILSKTNILLLLFTFISFHFFGIKNIIARIFVSKSCSCKSLYIYNIYMQCNLTRYVISYVKQLSPNFFSEKVTPKTIFSCRYVKSLKRYKKCNLTPWMVSNYNKNIAKKFVVKSCLC